MINRDIRHCGYSSSSTLLVLPAELSMDGLVTFPEAIYKCPILVPDIEQNLKGQADKETRVHRV